MKKRLLATAAPLPLEAYAAEFDALFARRSQCERFRRYLAGLLPAERNKTATGLANTEPTVGAQHLRAQELQWFLSESTWDAAAVNARRRPRRGAGWGQAGAATCLRTVDRVLLRRQPSFQPLVES